MTAVAVCHLFRPKATCSTGMLDFVGQTQASSHWLNWLLQENLSNFVSPLHVFLNNAFVVGNYPSSTWSLLLCQLYLQFLFLTLCCVVTLVYLHDLTEASENDSSNTVIVRDLPTWSIYIVILSTFSDVTCQKNHINNISAKSEVSLALEQVNPNYEQCVSWTRIFPSRKNRDMTLCLLHL